jgi:hypothetical protein
MRVFILSRFLLRLNPQYCSNKIKQSVLTTKVTRQTRYRDTVNINEINNYTNNEHVKESGKNNVE